MPENPAPPLAETPWPTPPSALAPEERAQVREVLNSPRFQDLAPRQVWAQFLDEGQYRCSWRTMYRVLAVEHQVRKRRHPLRHPAYTKPELLATAPNQLWSWDITKLRGPMVGTGSPQGDVGQSFGVIFPQGRSLSDDQEEQECRERPVFVAAQNESGATASSGWRPGSSVAGVWGGWVAPGLSWTVFWGYRSPGKESV